MDIEYEMAKILRNVCNKKVKKFLKNVRTHLSYTATNYQYSLMFVF